MAYRRDDRWLIDEEGNLTPEVLAASRNAGHRQMRRASAQAPRPTPAGGFWPLMARLVRIPLGIVIFETLCTVILFVIAWVHAH